MNEGGTIPPGVMDYKSKIHWPKGVPCNDVSPTYHGIVVTGSCESQPSGMGSLFELEEAVEEEGYTDISTQSPACLIDGEQTDNLISAEKRFVAICRDNAESSLIT